jgi:hypothetical protein
MAATLKDCSERKKYLLRVLTRHSELDFTTLFAARDRAMSAQCSPRLRGEKIFG